MEMGNPPRTATALVTAITYHGRERPAVKKLSCDFPALLEKYSPISPMNTT
jgi:hypothetical protein